MVGSKNNILWSKEALIDLKEIFDHIKKDSLAAAQKVKLAIFAKTASLKLLEKKFVKDSLKENNDGSYRVCFVYHYRISYRIKKDKIFILRLRHTSREPLDN